MSDDGGRPKVVRKFAGKIGPVGASVGLGLLLWVYRGPLGEMIARWASDSRYSHGYLVPAFAMVLLWLRRGRLAEADTRGALRPSAWGILPMAAGAGLFAAGSLLYNDWLEGVSLLPCLLGLALLTGGTGAVRWCWPAVAFLAFMVPLPYRLELALGWPLQRIATIASTYSLQTFGFAALGRGNVIQMSGGTLGVAEACSGLSMLILFFALATGVAMVVRRPLFDRLMIVASAVPIALASNISRITTTGVVQETLGHEFADKVFHDLAGWLMMPLALGLLGLEVWLLDRLWAGATPEAGEAEVGRRAPAGADPSQFEKPGERKISELLRRSLKNS